MTTNEDLVVQIEEELYRSSGLVKNLKENLLHPDKYLMLTNMQCTDAKGNIFESYPKLYISKDGSVLNLF